MTNNGSTLEGVEDFGGMKAEYAEVAKVEYRLSVNFYAKCVGGIVNELEVVGVCDLLKGFELTWVAINVYRHDCGGVGGYGGFYFLGVEIVGVWLYIGKYGFDVVPPKGVCGGNKAEGGGDYFAGYAQCLQSCDEGKCPVAEQTDVLNPEVFAKGLFQLLVELSVVGEPFGFPYLFEVGREFF